MITIKVLFTVRGMNGSFHEVIDVEEIDNKIIKEILNQRLKDHLIDDTVRDILFIQQL